MAPKLCTEYRMMSCHKTKSAALFRLLNTNYRGTQESDKHKKKEWKRAIVSKKEIKLHFPYEIQAQYEHRTAADTHLQYQCA